MKAKLTVRTVESIVPADRDTIIWDSELAGFGLKVTPKGRRTYFLYYRTREGQQRRPAIGTHGQVRPEQAREIAKRWLSDVANGNDPSKSRSLDRQAPTISELSNRYLDEYAKPRKKATSLKNDERIIKTQIVPTIGTKKAASISRQDISALHTRLRKTPYEANRMLSLISKMFALAEQWGIRPDGSNPAKNIARFKESKRERFLTEAEVAALWKLLNSSEVGKLGSPSAVAALKLLILTGRRLGEVLSLKWAYIDFTNRIMRLPDTKSGTLTVAINEAAYDVLIELKAKSKSDYVIPGAGHNQPLVNLQKPWRAIRAKAGLDDVRIHDLRHTFASIGAGLGMSLPMIGRLLGHSQSATTARYAHLAQNPVKVAADAIGAELQRIVGGDASG